MSLRTLASYEVLRAVNPRNGKREEPAPTASWVAQLRTLPIHPYNKDANNFICAFGNLLEHLDPQYVDLTLARLYAIAHGHQELENVEDEKLCWEGYKQIYTDEYGDIRRWVYEALVDKVLAIKDLFICDRFVERLKDASDEERQRYYHSRSWTSVSTPHGPDFSQETGLMEFGYTLDMSETTRVYFFDLANALEAGKIDFDCPIQQQHLRYTLEKLKMSLWQDSRRHELNYFEEAYGAPNSKPRTPLPETVPVIQLVKPLITIIPDIRVSQSTFASSTAKKEWDEYMLKYYDKDHCLMYGLLFKILSALRMTRIEGTLRDHHGVPLFYSWPEGPVEEDRVQDFSTEYGAGRWIASLPSYDPRFVITIDDYTTYQYRWKREALTEQCMPGFVYLHMAYHVFHTP